MPRPPQPRSIQKEAVLADRIRHERTLRGWSYDKMAEAMTEAGCPMQGSAIYKIENGNPRRRITVDELVALAQVLKTSPNALLSDDAPMPGAALLMRELGDLLSSVDQAEFFVRGAIPTKLDEVRDLAAALDRATVEQVVSDFLDGAPDETGWATVSTSSERWADFLTGVDEVVPMPVIQVYREYLIHSRMTGGKYDHLVEKESKRTTSATKERHDTQHDKARASAKAKRGPSPDRVGALGDDDVPRWN